MIGCFYVILSVHNYASKSTYIERKWLLCIFYAKRIIFEMF